MPQKRAAPSRQSSSDSNEDDNPRKRFRSTSPSTWDDARVLKVYIVQAKLEQDTLLELYNLIETTHAHGSSQDGENILQLELASDYADADIIITKVRMKKRLERHIEWDVAKTKAIVTDDWLRDTVKQGHPAECGDYAALRELHDETVEHCPDDDQADERSDTLVGSTQDGPSYFPPASHKPAVRPTNPRVFKNWASRYACTRASPLTCVNQALAMELGILGRARELEGLPVNALSYERSTAIIKSYPYLITREIFEKDIARLPGLGGKTLSKIEEFLDNGFIKESRETRESERFQSLSLFASIYGIGPVNARKLYDIGLRTFDDLYRYYDVPQGVSLSSSTESIREHLETTTPNGRKISSTKNALPDMSIKFALLLKEDLEIPIPRDEVEEIHKVVMKELEEIQPGCVSTIVGGFRRGKEQSNDVDIVISHADLKSGADMVKGLCKRFTGRLHTKGLVTHVMHLSSFHAHNALRTSHWDSLEKALTVFVLPADGKRKRIYRRLDLIFAAPESYWTAVVGWSGSRMFERDLRLWAKEEKGYKFDSSGLTRRHDSRLFVPRSEQEVFDILGLDWIDPTMRNANV